MKLRVKPVSTSNKPNVPAKVTLTRSPKPTTSERRRGRRGSITPEQEATAHRCHAQGISKADTATAAGLTEQQVHYLWYVKPRQQAQQAARKAEVTPLDEIVPEPITSGHDNTLPGHTYRGQPTTLRTDVIEQVKKCRGHRHPIADVAEHFRMKPATVRYIWYQIGTTKKHDTKA